MYPLTCLSSFVDDIAPWYGYACQISDGRFFAELAAALWDWSPHRLPPLKRPRLQPEWEDYGELVEKLNVVLDDLIPRAVEVCREKDARYKSTAEDDCQQRQTCREAAVRYWEGHGKPLPPVTVLMTGCVFAILVAFLLCEYCGSTWLTLLIQG
jgi:hypothetical protein